MGFKDLEAKRKPVRAATHQEETSPEGTPKLFEGWTTWVIRALGLLCGGPPAFRPATT